MKYYIGYYHSQEYIPIKSAKIGDSITSIVEYTTNFPTIKAIKEDLYNEGLIPSTQVRIDYVIEKGKKDNRDYQRLKVTDKIYTSESKEFFNISRLKEHLNNESNNLDFLSFLYTKYLKKFGFIKKIINYLLDANEERLEVIFTDLKKIATNQDVIKTINNILEYLDRNKGTINRDILEGYIESFSKAFTASEIDTTNFYIYLKKYITFRHIPAMSYLSQWLQLAIDRDKTGKEAVIDIPTEYINESSVVTSFYNELVYYYDYEMHNYKTENGKRKVNTREVFDLGVFVDEYFKLIYEDYLANLKKEPVSKENEYIQSDEEYEDDEKELEEYLEEDDFKRVGTTSEEMGYKIRRQGW